VFPAVLVLGLAATVSSCGIPKCKEMPYSLGSGEDNEIMPLTRYLVILSLFVATTPSSSNPASQSLPEFPGLASAWQAKSLRGSCSSESKLSQLAFSFDFPF
jgi:hypothetical protein